MTEIELAQLVQVLADATPNEAFQHLNPVSWEFHYQNIINKVFDLARKGLVINVQD